MITYLDGRNPNKVPEILKIPIEELDIASEWKEPSTGLRICCIRLDGQLVPCVRAKPFDRYDEIMCGSYKTKRGFLNWIGKNYPTAYRVHVVRHITAYPIRKDQ